jgi:uncharacterized protein (DUF362 family)
MADKRSGAARRLPKRDPAVRVCVTRSPSPDATALLDQSLTESGFWQHLEQCRRASRLRHDRFKIIIKPDLDCYDPALPDGTDPTLVEHMIDQLHDRGFRKIIVGDGRNCADAWLHNRDPLVVPDLMGYRFVTPKHRPYEIVDLQAAPAPDCISKYWLESHYRINFAKNKTHEEFAYALCLHNLAGVVCVGSGGLRDQRPTQLCLQVLRSAPPHFNLIDAFTSCHGGAGQRAPSRMETRTLIASANTLLADWAGAAKMGLDPHASPINDKALRQIGLPLRQAIEGELSPYPLWRNVHPLLVQSAGLRAAVDGLGRIVEPWFQSVDREHFPFKDFYHDRINAFVAPLMTQLDRNPRSFWTVVIINHLLAQIGSAIAAQYVVFGKDKLRRRLATLELDPADFDDAAYAGIADYLQPYQTLLESVPPNQLGLRWRHLDGSILFSAAHIFPIAFERFVAAVDITAAIQYMNDYIGGTTVPIHRDRRGRITHQIERNLYLQQPNWMAFFGGDLIDVEKLEFIEYGQDAQTIYWRTVASPNASASHDDGSVSFVRSAAGQTTVKIFARQQFALPALFRIFDVNRMPEIRNPIIERAYATFFSGTIANLQAQYEGRDFRIGRDAEAGTEASGIRMAELARYLSTAVAAVTELLRHREDLEKFGAWLFPDRPGIARSSAAGAVDHNGFRHFGSRPNGSDYMSGGAGEQAAVAGLAALAKDAPEILTGLFDAMRDDLARMADATGGDRAP